MSNIELRVFIDGKHVATIVRDPGRPGFWCADLVHFVNGKDVSPPVEEGDQESFRLAGLVEKIERSIEQDRQRSIKAAENLLETMKQAKRSGLWDVMQELPEWQRMKEILDGWSDVDEPCSRCGIQPCDCGDC